MSHPFRGNQFSRQFFGIIPMINKQKQNNKTDRGLLCSGNKGLRDADEANNLNVLCDSCLSSSDQRGKICPAIIIGKLWPGSCQRQDTHWPFNKWTAPFIFIGENWLATNQMNSHFIKNTKSCGDILKETTHIVCLWQCQWTELLSNEVREHSAVLCTPVQVRLCRCKVLAAGSCVKADSVRTTRIRKKGLSQ